MADINERVKSVRQHFKLNQTQFAEKIGVTNAAISQIENGKIGVSPVVRKSIIREYNVNPDWLDNGIGEMIIRRDKNDEYMIVLAQLANMDPDDPRREIISLFSKIPKKHWEAAATALEAFVNALNDD